MLQVLDFSDAERGGFIQAFVEFWTLRGDPRTVEDLSEVAAGLLRGCQQHFRANVTRLKKIHGVVGAGQENAFEARTLALLDAVDHDGFLDRAAVVIRDFPMSAPWLCWWMHPGRAVMLFSSEKKMSSQLWISLPSTTNAEEAMHWKIYSAVGRDHGILEGFLSLLRVSEYYKRLYDAVQRTLNVIF